MRAVAFLPMYDVAGTRGHADELWRVMRDAIRSRGIAAPEQVDRSMARHQGWLHPDLVLGQTCGLPYVTMLRDKVELIGTPDYGVEGCPPGFYHSTLVAASADRRDRLAQFAGATLALNGKDSQSGYGAIMLAAAPYARDGQFFGQAIATGSHASAMRTVAEGRADLAAIDSVTWRMSCLSGEAAGLKVIGTTEPTPGLPFIAALGKPAGQLFDAIRHGLAGLPDPARQAFGVKDLVPLQRTDYEVIAQNLQQAEAAHRLPEPIKLET